MTQLSFSTIWDGFATDASARRARDEKYRELKRQGRRVKRWVLRDQVRQYSSLGVADGRSCNVYKIDIVR